MVSVPVHGHLCQNLLLGQVRNGLPIITFRHIYYHITGPGAYVIKSTLEKNVESTFVSPPAITLKGRTKFGDPNARSSSKACANEPGILL